MLFLDTLWKYLFSFVSLFLFVTPFEILFGCGKKQIFEDSFLKSFTLPPQRNLHQNIFFFPLKFNDFLVFLYRTSELSKSTTAHDPAFCQLQQTIKSASFQTFLCKNNAANLKTGCQFQKTSHLYPRNIRNQSPFEIYEKWWSQTNHLYPYCSKESLELDKDEFGSGCFSSCYQVKRIISDENSLPFAPSKPMIFKLSTELIEKSASEVGLSSFVDLQELKFSLFFEFEKCSYILPLTCLVVSNEKDIGTVPVGYLCEEAEFGSLEFLFSYDLFGNRSSFLGELFHIAEAIQFLHDQRIIHNDIHTGNVLLFPEGNQVRMKLIDFGGSKTFEEYKQEQEFDLKLMKKQLFEDTPELIGLKSIDRLAIIRKDWLDYADFLADVIGNTRKDGEIEFEEIENLIVLLEDNAYWKLENILQTIKEYFDREIAN